MVINILSLIILVNIMKSIPLNIGNLNNKKINNLLTDLLKNKAFYTAEDFLESEILEIECKYARINLCNLD